jgi:hypothetical protein
MPVEDPSEQEFRPEAKLSKPTTWPRRRVHRPFVGLGPACNRNTASPSLSVLALAGNLRIAAQKAALKRYNAIQVGFRVLRWWGLRKLDTDRSITSTKQPVTIHIPAALFFQHPFLQQ